MFKEIPLTSHPGTRLAVNTPEREEAGILFLSVRQLCGLYLGAMMTLLPAEARELSAQLAEAADRIASPAPTRFVSRPATAAEFMQGKAL